MDIPKNITDQSILASLRAGVVIRMNTAFPNGGSAKKRLIVLTNKNKEFVLALTTTSNIDSPKRYYGKEDIFIKANSEKAFDLDTYIQLNRVIPISTEKIKIDRAVLGSDYHIEVKNFF